MLKNMRNAIILIFFFTGGSLCAEEFVELNADGKLIGTLDLDQDDFGGSTFNELIDENAEKGYKTVIAVARTGSIENPFSHYYHSSSILGWLFRGDNSLSPEKNRYNAGQEIQFKDPTTRQPLIDKIYFFEIGQEKEPNFIGTDEDLHVNTQTDKAKYLRQQVIKNFSDDLLKSLLLATTEKMLLALNEGLKNKDLARVYFRQAYNELISINEAEPESLAVKEYTQLLLDYIIHLGWVLEIQPEITELKSQTYLDSAIQISLDDIYDLRLEKLITFIKYQALIEKDTAESTAQARKLLTDFQAQHSALPLFFYIELLNIYFYGIGGPKDYSKASEIRDATIDNGYSSDGYFREFLYLIQQYLNFFNSNPRADFTVTWHELYRLSNQTENIPVAQAARFFISKLWLEGYLKGNDEFYIKLLMDATEQNDNIAIKLNALYWLAMLSKVGIQSGSDMIPALTIFKELERQNYLPEFKALATYQLAIITFIHRIGQEDVNKAKKLLKNIIKDDSITFFIRGFAYYWLAKIEQFLNNTEKADEYFKNAREVLSQMFTEPETSTWLLVEAYNYLGIMQFEGLGGEILYPEALQKFNYVLNFSRDKQETSLAHYYAALVYLNGLGVAPSNLNPVYAKMHLLQALPDATQDIKDKISYQLAKLYLSQRDQSVEIKAQEMGMLTQVGIKTPKGQYDQIARRFFALAAKPKSILDPDLKADAQFNYGRMLFLGIGGTKNTQEALRFLDYAAKQDINKEAKENSLALIKAITDQNPSSKSSRGTKRTTTTTTTSQPKRRRK